MFKKDSYQFKWEDIGDINRGRPYLGTKTSVISYRLMQYTLWGVLIKKFGAKKAEELFYEAGYMAGVEFCKNVLDTYVKTDAFLLNLQSALLELGMGVLKIEKADTVRMHFILTISEDLDCSGLPVTDETVCVYDEGFIAGIMKIYTSKDFSVKEIDCWATGDKTCRFDIKII